MNRDKTLAGIILIGGNSSRMDSPKFLLEYHSQSQLIYCSELLNKFCDEIFVSCNKTQLADIPSHLNVIVDEEKYSDAGPMTGILSSFGKTKKSIFILACDYPFITENELACLTDNRNPNAFATVFTNFTDSQPEPLIGIYEVSCYPLLEDLYSQNKRSLRKFLSENFIKTIKPLSPDSLRSVDAIDEFKSISQKLKSNSE